jgi:hypothetical protein
MSSFHLFQPSQLSRTFNIQKKEDLSSVFKLFSILVIFFSFFPSHTTSLSEKGKPSRPAPLRACAVSLADLEFHLAKISSNQLIITINHHQSPSITINHQNVSDSPTQSFEFLFIFLDLNIFSLKPTKRWDCGPTVSCPSLGEEVPSCGAPVNCSGFWDVECSGSQLCAVHAH